MAESRKKTLKIGAVVLCLLATIVVIGMNPNGAPRGLDSIPSGDTVLMKCENEQCGAVYRMAKREYYALVDEVSDLMPDTPASPPPVVCRECQEASARRAVKCTACGYVFFYGERPNDDPGHCAKCEAKGL